MTETELELPRTDTTPSSSKANAGTWDAAFDALKARYPRAKDSIVFCIYELQNNPEVALDDLKARASMHGIRVTGASVNAAQRLMAPEEARSEPEAAEAEPAPRKPRGRPARQQKAAGNGMDAEAMLRQVVAKIAGAERRGGGAAAGGDQEGGGGAGSGGRILSGRHTGCCTRSSRQSA